MASPTTSERSASEAFARPAASHRPLCVDLDGSLVKTDTLVDALLVMVRTHSRDVARLPGWALGGKARLKREVTERVSLDVAHLPYNKALLTFLEQQRGLGRELYLATGADHALAERVAKHLGIFTGVLASDGAKNLTGTNKLDAFVRLFGEEGFDYVGNASPDLPLLRRAATPMVANPHAGLRQAIRQRQFFPAQQFIDRRPFFAALQRALRLHQWSKNVLIFLPLLLAHVVAAGPWLLAAIAFLSFSLAASGTYVLNDLLDIEADRKHPRKRNRPFAAGDLQGKTGVLLASALLGGALLLSLLLPPVYLAWLLVYLAVTLSYSLYFKRKVIVDVVLLSGLYTLRLMAGSAAASVTISPWMGSFSIFMFLSLAMAKRFAELQNIRDAGRLPSNGRGYLLSDIEQMRTFGTVSGYAAVVVFSLYINALGTDTLYTHPMRLWLIAVLLILWISRVWLLASRGELDEDPVIFALTDRISLLLGVAAAAIVVLAAV